MAEQAGPLFLLSVLSFVSAAAGGVVLEPFLALAVATVAFALRHPGDAREPDPEKPHASVFDFLRRWRAEQVIIFPRFAASGEWSRRWRLSRRRS